VRARVAPPFRVVKRRFGHAKTRHRRPACNHAPFFTLSALGNPFLVQRKLMA
jgi:transposase, IS5 family